MATDKQLSPDDQTLLKAISDEVATLHVVWRNYRHPFGSTPEAVDVLNSVAPAFAHVIQKALLHEVVLHLSRLTDPASSGKNKDGSERGNLSLDRLRAVAETSGDSELVKRLDQAIGETKTLCEIMRIHRNKRVAHADLNVALEKELTPGYSRQSIEHALKALRDVMNELNLHYHGGPTLYESAIANGEGDSLLDCLRDGIALRKLRRQHHQMSDEEIRQAVARRHPRPSQSQDSDDDQ